METKNTKLISVSFDDIKNGVFCVPKHVKIIEENVFWSNDRIKNIELNNVDDIRDSAFQFSNIEEVDLSNVKYFGLGIFNYCKQLERVVWSKYQKSIPQYMFSGCIDLSSIDSKNSIVSIGKKAFCQCAAHWEFFPNWFFFCFYAAYSGVQPRLSGKKSGT